MADMSRRLAELDPATRAELVARLRATRRTPAEPEYPDAAVVPINSTGMLPPLFLLHPSGGSVLPYAPLAAELDPDRPCFGLQAAGLVGPPDRTVEALVEHCVTGLRSVQPAGPYRLAGWSAGGVLAFATALRLRALGGRTETLVLLDAEPPPRLAEPPDLPSTLAMFAVDFALASDRPPAPPDPAALAGLSEDAQLDRLVGGLVEGGMLRPELAGQVRARAQVFAATVRAGATWAPQRWDGPIELLVSEEVTDPDAAAEGWRRCTDGPVTVRRVPGDHYSMMRPPQVTAVAAAVEAVLR
jgi:thioesterase domain-containing protein